LTKVLSRLLSVSGFGLVLVLFFLLPFVSVSCEVPDLNGSAQVNYTGTHLVTGGQPELVTTGEFRPAEDSQDEEELDPGVQGLAIVLVVLAAAGLVMGLAPAAVARLGGAALAGATLVVTVVTLLMARANLKSTLLTQLQDVAGNTDPERLESGVDGALEVRVGFWLVVTVLVAVLLLNAGAALLSRRAREPSPTLGT
jgi:hypothetical protein